MHQKSLSDIEKVSDTTDAVGNIDLPGAATGREGFHTQPSYDPNNPLVSTWKSQISI